MSIAELFSYINVTDVLDIIATSVLIYYVMLLIRGTRAVQILSGVLVLVGLLALTLSSRGLTGTFSHAWQTFTTARGTNISDPHHLLSSDSENRWVWWKEAAGAASDRPLTGWGAGSFGAVHLLYRRDNLSVKQPHSVPLQWLAETGVVGALAAVLAFALLLAAAELRQHTRPPSAAAR